MTSVVYFITNGSSIKIGTTTKIKSRFSNLNTASVEPLTLLATIPGDAGLERSIHDQLKEHRRRGEWFTDCEPVRDAINTICGRDVFIISAPPQPRKKPDLGEAVALVLDEARTRLIDFSFFCLGAEGEGDQDCPAMRLPVLKRYLVIAAIRYACSMFKKFADDAWPYGADPDSWDNIGRAVASQEMVEAQVALIVGTEDAWFLEEWQRLPPTNPLFEVQQGKQKWRTREEASAAGWSKPHSAFSQYIERCRTELEEYEAAAS